MLQLRFEISKQRESGPELIYICLARKKTCVVWVLRWTLQGQTDIECRFFRFQYSWSLSLSREFEQKERGPELIYILWSGGQRTCTLLVLFWVLTGRNTDMSQTCLFFYLSKETEDGAVVFKQKKGDLELIYMLRNRGKRTSHNSLCISKNSPAESHSRLVLSFWVFEESKLELRHSSRGRRPGQAADIRAQSKKTQHRRFSIWFLNTRRQRDIGFSR